MKVTGSNVPTNEIGNVVVEVGCPEGDLVMQQGLLEADIETSTRFRSKIGIATELNAGKFTYNSVKVGFQLRRYVAPRTM